MTTLIRESLKLTPAERLARNDRQTRATPDNRNKLHVRSVERR